MQEQFAVLLAIPPDDNAVPDGHAAGCIGDDLSAPRCLSQLLIVRQRDPIDDQDPHAGRILNAASVCIGELPRGKRSAVFEDKVLLHFGPRINKWRQAFEFFLINHGAEQWPALFEANDMRDRL